MLKALDLFYHSQPEPLRGCFLALREQLVRSSKDITEEWKYRMPAFYYKGKPFCYLWKDNKTEKPYILFVDGLLIEHPQLVQGNRQRMKILPVDPNKNLPVLAIKQILKTAMVVRQGST